MKVNFINLTVNALIKRGRIQSNEFCNENIRSYWFRIFKSGGEGLKKKAKPEVAGRKKMKQLPLLIPD